MMTDWQRYTTVWVFSSMMLATTPFAFANPSSKQPTKGLAVHNTIEGSKEIADRLYDLYDQELIFVDKTYAQRNEPARFSDRQLAASAGRLWTARRDAKKLQVMGEPAGSDLYRKLQILAVQVYNFGQAYRGTPRGSQVTQRIITRLQRDKPKMAKFLAQQEKLLEQGKLDAWETQMEKKGQELYGLLTFFNAAGRRPFDQQFVAVLNRGDQAVEKARKAEYAQRVSDLIDEQFQPALALAGEGERMAKEIADNGQAQFATSGGAQLGELGSGGPVEAVRQIGTMWGFASAGLLRAVGLQGAFPAARPSTSVDAKQLKEDALASLSRIITSAAKSTAQPDVQGVYCGILEAISVIERRGGILSEDVYRACEPALQELVAKDPALASRIESYDRATGEVLRWRRAYASQQSGNLGRNLSRAPALLHQKGATEVKVRPAYVTQPFRESEAAPHLFNAPADWMVQEAADRLAGKSLVEDRLIRLTPTGRAGVFPFGNSHYANLRLPLSAEAQTDDLLSALTVDAAHRALTIEAARAVNAAELQEFETIGAEIATIYLESVVTRLITLPDAAYPLANLGTTPQLRAQIAPIEQTCWRLDLQPLWAQHTHFTVRMPKAAAAASP